jgi:hypothetical protein
MFGDNFLFIFNVLNFVEMIYLKCQNSRKLQRKKILKKIGGIPIRSFLLQASPPFARRYPIIDNIFLYYNLVGHYFSPFLQKRSYKKTL